MADCLGKKGALPGISPVSPGMFAAGPVRYIYGHTESNWPIHEQARAVEQGDIVFIDGLNVNDRALVGELVIKFLLLYRRASAVVALGNLRDANDLIKNRYAVWCAGYSPIGCFNKEVEETAEINSLAQERKTFYNGSIAVCDDTGVVVVPKEWINEDFYQKLEFIEQQEDTWFRCIDFYKWDTYDTVCLKKYLADGETLTNLDGEQ